MTYLDGNSATVAFKDDSINKILGSDICISEEVYNKFFELQSQGKQFKIKDINGNTFEAVFEEIIPAQLPYQPTQVDLIMEAIAQLDAQREKDKLETQLAIEELANSIQGGIK